MDPNERYARKKRREVPVTRKLGFAVIAALMLTATHAAAKGPTAPRTVFGIVWQDRDTSLARLHALTLRPASKSVRLGTAAQYMGRSPGRGMRAAFAIGEQGTAIRFVDLRAMKPERRVNLTCGVGGPALWETANRLVTTCGGVAASVIVVDPVRQRLVKRTALRGSLEQTFAANGRLVGLLAPVDGIGAARLVVVDGAGRARIVSLPEINAGHQVTDPQSSRFRIETPGIAIDPNGFRAAVVPARGAIAVVDLATLGVSSHTVDARTLATVRKELEGSSRTAVWTMVGTIAVSGTDWVADGQADHGVAAGLTLIDTDTWQSRRLDERAADVSYTGPEGVLLAHGVLWNSATQTETGCGLTGYGADGTQRYHAFGEEPIWIAALAGTYAYVGSEDLRLHRIVDTTTGKLLATVRTAKPTTIAPTQTVS
jgi:hypothetical protein